MTPAQARKAEVQEGQELRCFNTGSLRVALLNATVVHVDRLGADEALFLRDGVIEYVGAPRRPPAGYRSFDMRGQYVLPGLVDLHAHGALGRHFNEADEGAWQTVLGAHLSAGTTSLLATLVSDSPAKMAAALAIQDRLPPGSGSIGCHLEGPYLSRDYRGAHPENALRTPSDGSWPALLGNSRHIKLVTLAPELAGADAMIRFLAARNVAVSAGHSGAEARVMDSAHRAGLRHAAHLWSGQSTLAKNGPWRLPGLLEYVLGSNDLTAEIIADGCHVPVPLVRIAYRCLGASRLSLVSDASAGTGLRVGATFEMGAARGIVSDGVALDARGESFCGSTSFLADILRFAVLRGEIPLVDAVRMASVTPASVIGLSDQIGTIAVGRAADLLVLDRDLGTVGVLRAGCPQHDAWASEVDWLQTADV